MRNKVLALFLILSIFLSIILFVTAAEEQSFENIFIAMHTGSPGGGWYPFGGAIGAIWNKYIPGLTVSVHSAGGLAENLMALEHKRADIAFLNPDLSYQKYNGIDFYKGKSNKNMRMLFNITGGATHLIASPNSGIKTPLDFKGKRIGMPPVGNSLNLAANAIFDSYGLKEEDMKFFRGARADKADALKDGRVDVAIFALNFGSALVLDLIKSNNCNLVPVTGIYREKLIEKYPFYAPKSIPAEVYGLSEAVDCIGQFTFLGCDASLDENLTYVLTKTYFEHLDEIKEMYPPGKDLTIENAARIVICPIHPGSERYLKEQGILK